MRKAKTMAEGKNLNFKCLKGVGRGQSNPGWLKREQKNPGWLGGRQKNPGWLGRVHWLGGRRAGKPWLIGERAE